MKLKQTYFKKIVIILMGLFLLIQPSLAQSPLTAEVNRTNLSRDQRLTLTVTVQGDLPQLILPPLDDFQIIGQSQSKQVTMSGGNTNVQTQYIYQLQPLRDGQLQIPAISINANGQTFSTEPITIQVAQGNTPTQPPSSAQPQGTPAPETLTGQNFFVEADVDDPTPYQGQQIIYTLRFYQAIEVFQASYQAPNFNGFWNDKKTSQQSYNIQAADRVYRVSEVQTILFPIVADQITINPSGIVVSRGFFQSSQTLRTQPVVVDVQPLPSNAPPEFNGAVGQFELTATIDTDQAKVNEPITLLVTLSGLGNMENLPDPIWPDLPQWRNFESKATTNSKVENNQQGGNKIYERLLVPGTAGQFTIPAISYTYFDPIEESYKTITSEPIPISVAPAEAETPVPVILGGDKETVERIASDIRHIKSVPPLLEADPQPITNQTSYWLAWSIPLLLLIANFFWHRQQVHLQQNAGLLRSLQAHKKAQKALNTVKQKADKDFYSASGQILTTYLSDKFNRSIVGLTQTDLTELLQKNNLEPNLIKRIHACLMESDMGRFAPSNNTQTQANKLLKEVEKLIDDLEKAKK